MDDGLVDKLLFFRDKEASFIGTIIPLLVPQDVAPGELIYKIGDHSNSSKAVMMLSVLYKERLGVLRFDLLRTHLSRVECRVTLWRGVHFTER